MRNFRLGYNIITHKFYTGQGLHLNLNLMKRTYKLKVETIWEDYGIVEIQGLSGVKNFIFDQFQCKGSISDELLDINHDENIDITLKLPQYSSYDTKIYGSVDHVQTFVDSKFRGRQFSIDVLSKGHNVNLKYIQAQKFNFVNPFGKVNIQTLIGKNGSIISSDFEAQKIMISQQINLKCRNGYIRSLLCLNSIAEIQSHTLKCDSIQGHVKVKCSNNLKIDRWYAGKNQIDIKAQHYDLKIQSGTGSIVGEGNIVLGNRHEGKCIKNQKQNLIQIIDNL